MGRLTIIFVYFCISIYHAEANAESKPKSFYSFVVKDPYGEPVDLVSYHDTVTLVVNVASQCGYTDSHYKALARLQTALGRPGKFQILAFPSNQFGGQEPWPMMQILDFVYGNYLIEFPILHKIDVIGDNADPAFKFLAESSGKAPTWNFWKYAVGYDGKVYHAWGPDVSVENIYTPIIELIEQAEQRRNTAKKSEL